jgi:hypothetical protein
LQALALAKRNFFMAGNAKEKRTARNAIRAMRLIALRNLGLKHTPEGDSPDPLAQKHVHWKLDFAEIFAEPPTVAATGGRGKSTGVIHADGGTGKAPGDPGYNTSSAGLPGFDIMIANPPYVRQELIEAGLREFGLGISKSDLIAIYQKLTGIAKLNAKSDLYVYFFYRALMLLKHDGGIFCFICSNSWLDVGYGAQLQEYILKHCEVRAIIDNSAKRSFASADVNTTINLFVTRTNASFKDQASSSTPSAVARFIAFRKSFEDAATEPAMRKALAMTDVTSTSDYRVYPIAQDKLFTAGLEQDTDTSSAAAIADRGYSESSPVASEGAIADRGSAGHLHTASTPSIKTSKTIAKYGGDKWGGKYLRAPDILFTIRAKANDKLISLSEVAAVRFGIKTGCNEFFHLPNEHYSIRRTSDSWTLVPTSSDSPLCTDIPCEFIRPLMFSLKEISCFTDTDVTYRKHIMVIPPCEVKKLPAGVRAYIEWGQTQLYDKGASCASRKWWYSVAHGWLPAPFVVSSKIGERMVATWNRQGILEDKKLYGVTPKDSHYDPYQWLVLLNSSWLRFYMEMTARQLTGAQAIADVDVKVYESLLIVDPRELDKRKCKAVIEQVRRKIESCFVEYGLDRMKPVETQMPSPMHDRAQLDNILFDYLDLSHSDRNEVYSAISSIVKQRLDKANSV